LPDRALSIDVRAVLDEYFRCVDAHDFEGAGDCFTPDAESEFAGRRLAPGRPAIVDFLRGAMSGSRSSRHFATNVAVERVDEDLVRTETAALVFAIGPDDGTSPRLTIRGVRYRDELRRRDGEWRIARRVHRGEWMADAPVTLLSAPDQTPA
jgi:uncharacterized protein (TIGR02246 family)